MQPSGFDGAVFAVGLLLSCYVLLIALLLALLTYRRRQHSGFDGAVFAVFLTGVNRALIEP